MFKSVLIADDDEFLADILCERCKSLGLFADVAFNAMSALGKIDEMEPDIVVLDVEMPYGNGLSVCEMMSTHEQLLKIPVIILSGRSDSRTIRRCHELGAYYVNKQGDVWPKLEPLIREMIEKPAAVN
jgi:DNA-binding response OmpR family regulator